MLTIDTPTADTTSVWSLAPQVSAVAAGSSWSTAHAAVPGTNAAAGSNTVPANAVAATNTRRTTDKHGPPPLE